MYFRRFPRLSVVSAPGSGNLPQLTVSRNQCLLVTGSWKFCALEVELEPQLNLTGDRRRRDRPERARRPVAVGRTKVLLVQQVKCLHPRFEAGLITTETEVLVQPEIELVERI